LLKIFVYPGYLSRNTSWASKGRIKIYIIICIYPDELRFTTLAANEKTGNTLVFEKVVGAQMWIRDKGKKRIYKEFQIVKLEEI
jgi:hypothetical protein